MYNKIVASPGNDLLLGSPEGGVLLLQRTGQTPGAMTLADLQARVLHLLFEDAPVTGGIVLALADLQNRTWHLLREPGPDTGDAIVTTGDFNATVVTRDLNVAQGLFLSQTGVSYVGSPIMANPTDVPAVPPQYAMALVYRVLVDYWQRKADAEESKAYEELYAKEVTRASRGQGNFSPTTLTRDLNIALAQFISDTGIAPAISDRMAPLPVFPVLDYPLPPDLVGLARVEYTPQGQYPYVLIPMSFTEFDSTTGGIVPPTTGQPRYYRAPYAGYIRLQPAPSAGNAAGPATALITFTTTPAVGQIVSVRLVLSTPPTTVSASYTTLPNDTAGTVAAGISAALNASLAVQGTGAFLAATTITAAPSNASSAVALTALSALVPNTALTYYVTVSPGPMIGGPTVATTFKATGDIITLYYTSLGTILANTGDSPGIPPQFHMALVYRVLMDYWQRKNDGKQSMRYEQLYGKMVERGKSYTFDMDRATQPTIAGDDTDDYPSWP